MFQVNLQNRSINLQILSSEQKRKLRTKVGQGFSPAAPISIGSLFAGRTKQLEKLHDALPVRGRHAIVYGERGVGKTSLAYVLKATLELDAEPGEGVMVPYTSCDSTDTFDSVWRKIFNDMKVLREDASTSPPTVQEGTAADTLPTESYLTPDSIRRYLDFYGNGRTLAVIIDEFDCLSDPADRRLFAETIKLLSDRATPATVVLVGVADDVASLLAEHASIERALVQVQMPRMSRKELLEIIHKALAHAGMTIDPPAAERITFLSQGLPHYTHLLGLDTARAAIELGSLTIRLEHVNAAVETAIENAQASIKDSYHKATMCPHKDNLFGTVLLACAIAQGDVQGYFAAADVRKPMWDITKIKYGIPSYSRHLHDFCEENRGMVLRKIGEKHSYRFRFANPLLQPYVILKGLAGGEITEEVLGY
jgi:Cdc6-like AAA superfamily ATPase